MRKSTMQLLNETREQLADLLERHEKARAVGSGWSGLPADIASLSAAIASLEAAQAEHRR